MADTGTGGTGPGDYDYRGSGLSVRVDTDNAANNGAQQLDGYELPVAPRADWPGLSADPNGIRVKRAELEQLAADLDAKANHLMALPAWLTAGAGGAAYGPANWAQAAHLQNASDLVTKTVADYLGKTVANLRQAADSIRAAVQTYTEGDHASESTSRNVNSTMGGGTEPLVF